MTDKHARHAPHNARSMNDLITKREALAMMESVLNRYHAQYHAGPRWYRRLWARIARREG